MSTNRGPMEQGARQQTPRPDIDKDIIGTQIGSPIPPDTQSSGIGVFGESAPRAQADEARSLRLGENNEE